MSKCNFLNAKKKILHINCVNFLFLFYGNIISQYRDPFSEKRRRPSIKKNNNLGLLYSKTFIKRQNDSFTNYKRQNGIIGIDNDPFKITGK